MNAIEIHNITKKFNDFTAINDISLDIIEGEIFGLLGPNGAGKTTTISMLATILQPTSGHAVVWNHDIVKEKDAVRKSIGIVFQDPSLDDELTGKENLDFHGRMYKMKKEYREERIVEVLQLVELEDKANNLVKTYSGGMKRRLEIARGLMHSPKVLFLDEPTLGLDPQTRRRLWDYIKKINQEQKLTIILTTHYMDEADFLCDRIAIIDQGKIIALDTPEKLKEILGGDVVSLETSETDKFKELLDKLEGVKEVKVLDKKLNITVDNGSKLIPKIFHLSNENNITVDSVTVKRPSLEDVFIHYTGRTIRDESTDGNKEAMRQRVRMGWR